MQKFIRNLEKVRYEIMLMIRVILVVSYALFLFSFWRAVYSQKVFQYDIDGARKAACNYLKWTVGYGLVATAMIVLLAYK